MLNERLLRSALEMPKARFHGRDLHKTTAYLFHIIQNHPFVDGNKRTDAMTAMVVFASNLKGGFSMHEAEYQDLILNVAQGNITKKKEIAKFFRDSRHS